MSTSPAESVWAVVVSYRDPATLAQAVEAASHQVSGVLVIDNGSGSEARSQIVELARDSPFPCHAIFNEDNVGIASALNQALLWARNHNVQWMLTLDQDTIIEPGAADKLLATALGSPLAAIVAPVSRPIVAGSPVDPGPKEMVPFEVALTHTSGNLLNVAAADAVGGFCDDLFIDHVDYDLCIRLRRSGYKILVEPRAITNQSFGETRLVIVGKKFRFFTANRTAVRHYYMTRNGILVARRHRDIGYLLRHLLQVLKTLAKVVMVEDDRASKSRATLVGLWDGCRGVAGRATKSF